MPVKNLNDRKNALRAKHRKLHLMCPSDIKNKLDNSLAKAFLKLDEYKNCNTLFSLVSSQLEVDTLKIMETALKDGKRLAVPRCADKAGHMDFYYITSLDLLEKGAYSIMEPSPLKCEKVNDLSDGVCIVPGLCFDLYGYRLGFGKGYYDRFLQNFGGITVGLCYSRCIEHKLPTGIFDIPVDILITEKYTNYTKMCLAKE